MNYKEFAADVAAKINYDVIDVDPKNKVCHIQYNGKKIRMHYDPCDGRFYGEDDESEYIFPDRPGGGWIKCVFEYETFSEQVTSYAFMQAVRLEMRKKDNREISYKVLDIDPKRKLCHIQYNEKIIEIFYDYYDGRFRAQSDGTNYIFPDYPGGGWIGQVLKKYETYSERVTSYEFMQAVMTELTI